jgi:hypothetical protein
MSREMEEEFLFFSLPAHHPPSRFVEVPTTRKMLESTSPF